MDDSKTSGRSILGGLGLGFAFMTSNSTFMGLDFRTDYQYGFSTNTSETYISQLKGFRFGSNLYFGANLGESFAIGVVGLYNKAMITGTSEDKNGKIKEKVRYNEYGVSVPLSFRVNNSLKLQFIGGYSTIQGKDI
ncbi:hypothetical protein BFG04_05980 [Campylobacter pinnipediorum subsp. pinnipediorum]|uniref:Outer membrane protein beta-barrel domain-containing protein n=1 Tax=Campylobacter pinnipediorum subsp. pinnipediorum TaxID=1660067 RepID=A0AAX0L9E4_9BACT|nr:hypothetical protein [Campylobacter pinnipediorum]OPA75033.1 hypothetical protein BFG04_05980 [Campylobacter pinnipediorum subsp. pinnipediorum]